MRPTFLTPATSPERFVGKYGTDWRDGVLSEHLDLFKRAGGAHRPSPSDMAGWALVTHDDGTTVAYPVVCSELIEVFTEDGRQSGRCGHPALDETGTCPAHDPRPYDS
jgi:hypothetical protein